MVGAEQLELVSDFKSSERNPRPHDTARNHWAVAAVFAAILGSGDYSRLRRAASIKLTLTSKNQLLHQAPSSV